LMVCVCSYTLNLDFDGRLQTSLLLFLLLCIDISWQTALANSAVSAAEDVRSTVRAVRTAANAKAAASSAALAAQSACESGKFSSIDEARAAQTRASIAQSHAIHAAVVEHEAKTVKRRATLALAHDVKCWNVHRKREILQTCLSYARSQHEATRRAVDAWSCLRDGYIGSTMIPATQTRKSASVPARDPIMHADQDPSIDDVTATIYGDLVGGKTGAKGGQPVIVPVEHDLFKQPTGATSSRTGEIISAPAEPTILPLVMASVIHEEFEDLAFTYNADDNGASLNSQVFGTGLSSQGYGSSVSSQGVFGSVGSQGVASSLNSQGFTGSQSPKTSPKPDVDEIEELTSSMQSLVNGLMNWGGQYDSEEDFALPTGMAASIALEESGVAGSQKIA
jgi:hypothetical protein